MDFTFENITIIVTLLLTGLSAGLCFTWSNAVTPGIGNLNDLGFLKSFQEMNRAIINPTFFIVFFGPFFGHILNVYLYRNQSSSILWMLITAGATYIFGVVLVTVFGNVPLNEILDKTNLQSASIEELKSLRDSFEKKWNRLHMIRTISSTTSFIIIIVSLLQISKSNI